MDPLPAPDLRSNVATWAVPGRRLPAVGCLLPQLLPAEEFDPSFLGQHLRTAYFDTQRLALRRARRRKGQYLTLRLRCYQAEGRTEGYALSAKTEVDKWRTELDADTAAAVLASPALFLPTLLPVNLLALVDSLAWNDPLMVAAVVRCTRYAVADDTDRLTLDVDVCTDAGKGLPFGVLEFKCTDMTAPPPAGLQGLGLRPLKLSKFLWATEV
jgi:hypothetical protein